jgi:hypothetical protein
VQKKRRLNDLINQKLFRFDHLSVAGIDNETVAKLFSRAMLEQEVCLFAEAITNGDEYCRFLHKKILNASQNREPLPVARFADGEYAFYNCTLACNGLYKQAESVEAIKTAMPEHIAAMKYVAANGFFAPLIFPGNAQTNADDFFSFFQSKKDSSGADFLDFLYTENIILNSSNYIPFYVVYAYLSSAEFAAAMNGKNICILNSEYNKENCRKWFVQFKSHPHLSFVEIPAEYVATRWEIIKKELLKKISPDTDLCLAGAGVGALLVCADVAGTFSIPAIDAGHVLNMMNDRVDKSNGARLYTLRKNQ